MGGRAKCQEDRDGIVLDGEVISAPVVNSVPLGKSFYIEGLREPGEVQTLANALMNPLDNPLKMDTMQYISPTLGSAVVHQGLLAGALSLIFTFLFVLIYYRVSGFIAIIGLCVNTVILFGIMAMLPSWWRQRAVASRRRDDDGTDTSQLVLPTLTPEHPPRDGL